MALSQLLVDKGILTNEEITKTIKDISNPNGKKPSVRPEEDDSTAGGDIPSGGGGQQELPFEQGKGTA